MEDSLLRLKDVLKKVPVHYSTWYRWCAKGRAPSPTKRGRTSFWRASEIQDFISKNSPDDSGENHAQVHP